jgi:hypothetical protein
MLNIVVQINLLYLARQLGKKISKLSLVESEYFRALIVKGQNILKIANTIPSATTRPIHIQNPLSILFAITAYKR